MKRDNNNWKDIEVANKTFARFLGYEYIPLDKLLEDDKYRYKAGWQKLNNNGEPYPVLSKLCPDGVYLCRKHRDLEFHSNYNWLISVIEKLESVNEDGIVSRELMLAKLNIEKGAEAFTHLYLAVLKINKISYDRNSI